MDENYHEITLTDFLTPAKGVIIGKVLEGAEELMEGEFIKAGDTHNKPMRIEVSTVGERTKDTDLDIKVGDTVLLPKYGNIKVKIGSLNFQMFRYRDVIGVL